MTRWLLGPRPLAWALSLLLGVCLAGSWWPAGVQAEDVPRRAHRSAHGKRSKASAVVETPAKAARPEKKKRARRSKGRAAEAQASATSETPVAAATEPEGPSGAREAAQAAASGVNAQIVKEGDTSVKVMEFTGLGIEGRVKSPQLMYFVQRVRAEFDRPVLPHRSFMPELEDSTAREPVR